MKTIQYLIKCIIGLGVLAALTVLLYYYRYRFVPLVSIKTDTEIIFKEIEGYTDKLNYAPLDTMFVSTNATVAGKAYVLNQQSNEVVDSFPIEIAKQKIDASMSELGCKWNRSNAIYLDTAYTPGYYTIQYIGNKDTTYSHFIVENRQPSKVVVLAPLATWVAYNGWGGKSLYVNHYESKTVYYAAARKPFYTHINKGEINLTQFFLEHYEAGLFPDYALEYDYERLKQYDIIVLAYHCEYFSQKMYDNLERLVKEEYKSLISLGGNQIYWKIKWNDDYTVMECRKDLTSFQHSILDYGGMWRHHIGESEDNLLGVRFTEGGMHSYAPYKVEAADHWMYEGIEVENGSVFGQTGVNQLPLSGAETDKPRSIPKNMTILAKGVNCAAKKITSNTIDKNCHEEAMAYFTIIENEKNNILATGSIESGAGLGIDTTLTKMINNFIDKN